MKFLNSLSKGLKKIGSAPSRMGVTGHKLGILPYLAVVVVVIIYFLFKGGVWVISNFGWYILIVGMVLLALFLIWKFFPSIKTRKIPKWVWLIALAILLGFGWPYAWHRYIKPYLTSKSNDSGYSAPPSAPDNHANDYPDIPTITYGIGQHLQGGPTHVYKYRCLDDNGNHLKVFFDPQHSDNRATSGKLDINGYWGQVTFTHDDVVDITKN